MMTSPGGVIAGSHLPPCVILPRSTLGLLWMPDIICTYVGPRDYVLVSTIMFLFFAAIKIIIKTLPMTGIIF